MAFGALLIPIYEPLDKHIQFLKSFKGDEFTYFLVVDDGSGNNYDSQFKKIDEETCFEMIRYGTNQGKGHALKYGMEYLINKYEKLDYILTADGDGQHLYKDILKVKDEGEKHRDKLVLGARDLHNENVPKKSAFGNVLSDIYFTFASKKQITDTQTGLRFIPKNLFDLALEIPGKRYEYEIIFLIEAAKINEAREMNITTVYEDNNAGTHFRPVRDTMRIQRVPILSILTTIIVAVLSLVLFYIFSSLVFPTKSVADIYLSSLVSGYISGILSFLFFFIYIYSYRRKFFFRHLLRAILVITIFVILSASITYLFSFTSMPLTLSKFISDLFVVLLCGGAYLLSFRQYFKRK